MAMQRTRGFRYPSRPHETSEKYSCSISPTSALDSNVIAWSQYDGTGERRKHMAGEREEPPYASGLAALRDGWRLLQIARCRRTRPDRSSPRRI
jgi:hypothetical protein